MQLTTQIRSITRTNTDKNRNLGFEGLFLHTSYFKSFIRLARHESSYTKKGDSQPFSTASLTARRGWSFSFKNGITKLTPIQDIHASDDTQIDVPLSVAQAKRLIKSNSITDALSSSKRAFKRMSFYSNGLQAPFSSPHSNHDTLGHLRSTFLQQTLVLMGWVISAILTLFTYPIFALVSAIAALTFLVFVQVPLWIIARCVLKPLAKRAMSSIHQPQ